MRKKIIVFLLFLLLGIACVTIYKFSRQPLRNIINTVTSPKFNIENAPPVSIKGEILTMSGDIFYQDRIATQDAKIRDKVILKQGETIRTGEDANLTLTFPNTISIQLFPATQLEFFQTLPANFVTRIASGSALFKKEGSNPVSIKAAHLLINQDSGVLSVGMNNNPQEETNINLNIIEGQITVAYNDTNLVSHVQSFDAPKRITFNDYLRKFE